MEKAHKKLEVWKEAINFVKMIYLETQNLPREERLGLMSQMRRSAVSIPSNIAEGAARRGLKEAIRFFTVARGSISELDTQLTLCLELKFLEPSIVLRLTSTLEKVDSLLSGLIRYRRKQKMQVKAYK
ncbi:MAG: four helix bundle protein [Elusimicrobia bacterium]|nr:four helix bundle protein [Elusimicrobiota bacterium]